MTAKIKLNAASGGGSIAINAPSSAGSDTDLLDTSGNLSLTGNCKVGTITDTSGNNSSTTAQIAQGRAKAWVNFNGTGTVAIRDSFNVSSITDNGTGDYTINFTSALANANYVVTGTSGGQSNTSNGAVYQYDQATAKTTSACRILLINTSGGVVDPPQIAVAVFGD